MPYSYPNNVPRVAKSWNAVEKRKCTAAANAVLTRGGSEEDAVFACIHAAGKTRKKQFEDEYDEAGNEALVRFRNLVKLFVEGLITLETFREYMREGIKDQYVRMMLLGLDGKRDPTQADLDWINDRLIEEYDYLEGFMEDIRNGRGTEQRWTWRAGLYAFPRAAYTNFTIPSDVSELMPVLPGDDCLGSCHCSLSVEQDEENVYVYWSLDPTSESCPVCLAHALESPYVFSLEELGNADTVED